MRREQCRSRHPPHASRAKVSKTKARPNFAEFLRKIFLSFPAQLFRKSNFLKNLPPRDSEIAARAREIGAPRWPRRKGVLTTRRFSAGLVDRASSVRYWPRGHGLRSALALSRSAPPSAASRTVRSAWS